jgi:hypothetical protein
MKKQLPTTNVETGKSSRASKGLPCKPCGRSVEQIFGANLSQAFWCREHLPTIFITFQSRN